VGLPEPWASERGSPLTHSFCQHAVASREPLLVDDAREHPLLRDNLAIRDMGVIAYAGIPLIDPDGHALGTLCVTDSQPRHWTTHQVRVLSDLAASVVTEINLARAASRDRPE
jgi:GAF domain-containing protein